MNYRMYISGLTRIMVLLLFLATLALMISAQYPPAIGPDTYIYDADKGGNKVTYHDYSAKELRDIAATIITKILKTTNDTLKQQGKNYHADLVGNVNFYSPYRTASLNPRTPNQYYVRVPMDFNVKISVPHTSDRIVHYPLEIDAACDGWSTGSGIVTFTGVPGAPDISGGNVVENVLQVRDLINQLVRTNLPAQLQQLISFDNKCVTIGASPSNIETQNSWIGYNRPSVQLATQNGPWIEVTYERLKRLSASGNGKVLYSPVENVRLEAYANYDERQSQNRMFREGDVTNLSLAPVLIKAPLPNMLVIIASINQPGGTADDTSFTSALKTANFSPGEHTIQIPKEFIIPPGHGITKPTIVHVPGYELTYKVVTHNPTTIGRPGGDQ